MNYIGKIFIFFLLLNTHISKAEDTAYEEVNFDLSMGIKNSAQYNLMLRDQNSNQILDFYRQIYNQQLPSKKPYLAQNKIPKVIHQIWIGSDKVPESYLTNQSACKNLHPSWQYKLWTDTEIKKHDYDKHKLYDAFKGNILAQKEIIQYQILRDFGGVVIDVDFICLKKLDELHHKYDFYTALQPPSNKINYPVFTSSVIASKKNNPIFNEALELAEKKYSAKYKKVSNYFKKIIYRFNSYLTNSDKKPQESKINHLEIITASLGEVYRDNYNFDHDTIIFPSSYFSPYYPSQSAHYGIIDKIKLKLGIITEQQVFASRKPETIAVQLHQN